MIRGLSRALPLLVLTAAMASPVAGQISLQPTPAPKATAESTNWYQSREPILFNGNVYYPTGPQVFFNGNEMVPSGFYRGVQLYTRTTLEPNSYVFAPLAGGLMQPYERRRSGELAGTVGSSAPSFPVERASEATDFGSGIGQAAGPPTNVGAMTVGSAGPYPTDSSGTYVASAPVGTGGQEERPAPALAVRKAKPRPGKGINAIYVTYAGKKWVSSGSAVRMDPARFKSIGLYNGAAVYEDASRPRTIYVAIPESSGTLLAPYSLKTP
jgi:hypothetical protein